VNGPATFLEALQPHFDRFASKDALIFLGDGANETDRLSYGALERRSRAVSAAVAAAGLGASPVLLVYPPGLEFAVALIGCFRAGAIAVPTPYLVPNRAWERIAAIARDVRPKAVLTLSALVEQRDRLVLPPELSTAAWIATDTIGEDNGAALPSPGAEAIALVQYSSGSTGAPKGVVISHANLVHNQEMLKRVFAHRSDSVGITWVPTYHDMGLIGGLLQTLYCGASSILLPPLHVLQRPWLWLQAISRYRGTTSMGPTFAYEFCTRRIAADRRTPLDLASWEVAICGAEPVRAGVLSDFADTFAPVGFSPAAFVPAYGLAEATLMTTAMHKGGGVRVYDADATLLERNEVAPHKEGRMKRLVSCGEAHLGQEIRIVDPVSRRVLGDSRVGEIWLAGGSVGKGYWNRPDETEATFHAVLADGSGTRYLRTGDLGFLAEDGLFVTGRLKEILIIRGVNYYPQDIEQAVCAGHPSLVTAEACAFGVEDDGQDGVVVVVEPARTEARHVEPHACVDAAVANLSRSFGLRLHDFVLVRPGGLPRTTSGKLQRGLCRALYLAGELPDLGVRVDHPALGRRRSRENASPAP
jgi:acyl-CoA synthetase (AMP-forming)/AMP-acid ligase II